MKDKTKRLKQIEAENYLWIIYLIIIFLSYYGNYFEKDYFLNDNIISKEKYRKINFFIFSILFIVYAYYEKDAFENLFNDTTNGDTNYNVLVFIATSCVLISGFIFLYIIANDKNLDTEISFN